MSIYRKLNINIAALCFVAATGLTISVPAQAGDGGAFFGGMITSHVIHSMRQQDAQQAYNSQPHTVTVVQQAPAKESVESRITRLDKLAAGGYISKEEYKAKKKDILNSL